MSELRYCLACKKQTKFDFLGSDWFCDDCGRNEIVSKKFNLLLPRKSHVKQEYVEMLKKKYD